jgi:uncharacterized membrane protein YhaH (DUF805 family)
MKYDMNFFFSFEGRMTRKEYWKGYVVVSGISLVLLVMLLLFFPTPAVIGSATIVYTLSTFASLAQLTKRLHDRGFGAKWMLMFLVPIAGWIWLVIQAGFFKGEEGQNKYGQNPILAQ